MFAWQGQRTGGEQTMAKDCLSKRLSHCPIPFCQVQFKLPSYRIKRNVSPNLTRNDPQLGGLGGLGEQGSTLPTGCGFWGCIGYPR